MKRARKLGLTALLGTVLTIGALVACKQNQNDHCQVNADCSDGLVCAQATQTCETTSGAGIDAETPDVIIVIDAPDAQPADAAPDAPDAAPGIDAAPDAPDAI